MSSKRPELLILWDKPSKTGHANKVLDRLLADNEMDDEDFILSAVEPPAGKKYGKKEIPQLQKWYDHLIEQYKPKYVMVLGANSYLAMTGETGIRKARGKAVDKKSYIVVPSYHPSMEFHDPRNYEVMSKDFAQMREIMSFGGIPEERELNLRVVENWGDVEEMLADLKGEVSSDLETTRLYPFTTAWDEIIEQGGKLTQAQEDLHRKAHCDGKKDKTLEQLLPRVVSIQFGTKTTQWVIPAETAGIWADWELTQIVDRITDKLEDCYLIGHNWKFDMLWMRVRFGVTWECQFDNMLAHYILDENDLHGLKYLAMKYLGAPDWDVDGKTKTTWSMKNAKYAAHDVFYTRKLCKYLKTWLREEGDCARVLRKILIPCIKLFMEAEMDGVYIDQSKFQDAEDFLREELAKSESDLDEWAHPEWPELWNSKKGCYDPINWGSPKQLGRLLYDDLHLPCTVKTKTGGRSAGESALNQIDHPMVGHLLKYRGHKQQLSFFIEGWMPYLDARGYLHPSFKLIGTVTGRLSCEHPNLQQVPRDARIRSLITAPEGWTLVEWDLSQIELRIAAELANEPAMIYAFTHGIDVHWLTSLREIERGGAYHDEVQETCAKLIEGKLLDEKTAAMVAEKIEKLNFKSLKTGRKLKYGECIELMLACGPDACKDVNKMWKEARKKAKAINFGYLYGMWWKKFKLYARDNYGVEVTDDQAQASRTAFFALYGGFPAWHDRQRRYARMNGYVKSLSGRKRRLPDAMNHRDTPQRREAERQAINSPVQSFANDLNLMSALQLADEFGRRYVRLCGTVHDACLARVRNDKLEEVFHRMLRIMEKPDMLEDFEIELSIPIEADGTIGPWGAGLSYDKWKASQMKEAA